MKTELTGQFLCLRCPLTVCDETHPDCLVRLEEKVAAERYRDDRIAELKKDIGDQRRRLAIMENQLKELENQKPRSIYFRFHYLLNKDAKLASANARNARLREAAIAEGLGG